jgi:hypothetical protein
MKYEIQSQTSLMMARLTIVGFECPIWNPEVISRSNTTFIMDLLELMIKGTSGLSKARVDEDRAASAAEVRNWTEDRRTYVTEACRTLAGTNADSRLCG